jgi:hypothetical protein
VTQILDPELFLPEPEPAVVKCTVISVDAVISGRQYVITHGAAFVDACQERAALLDQAFVELAARREATGE